MTLELAPITLAEANEFVETFHRHYGRVVGHKFSKAVTDGHKVRGVCIVGRPVARGLDDGWTLEVSRCCRDGTKNACSKLDGAAWRAAKALGYHKLVTYTGKEEPGITLKAAGWKLVGEAGGGNWNTQSRPRVDTQRQQMKLRWETADGDGKDISL